MLKQCIQYLQLLLYRVVLGAKAIQAPGLTNYRFPSLCIVAYFLWDVLTRKTIQATEGGREGNEDLATMSDKQVQLAGSGNRQVEQESSEETTLSETSKDLGHTKMSEKTAQFQAQSNTSIVEENASQNIQSSCNVVQSVSQSVSQSVTSSQKVTTSSFSSAESFSMEETEEYEFEG